MSNYQFIASTIELPEIENPHVHLYSINEALAHGLSIEESILEMDIDPDEPEVLLWFESEELLGEITVQKEEEGYYSDPYTQLPYRYTFEWGRYTQKRAEEIITFLNQHMQSGSIVELWDTWMDDIEEPVVKILSLDHVTPQHIQAIFGNTEYEKPTVLSIQKS